MTGCDIIYWTVVPLSMLFVALMFYLLIFE